MSDACLVRAPKGFGNATINDPAEIVFLALNFTDEGLIAKSVKNGSLNNSVFDWCNHNGSKSRFSGFGDGDAFCCGKFEALTGKLFSYIFEIFLKVFFEDIGFAPGFLGGGKASVSQNGDRGFPEIASITDFSI
ncbi:hypothetical protein R1479_01188 [Ralstonia mannitolilytica]|nr:hypothetical protein R1479_01188 [Ralstonia mannitolilytica]